MGAFYYFTAIIYIAFCIAAGFITLSAFAVSQRRLLLFLSLFVLLYSLEQSLVFFNEFLSQNLAFQAADFHQMENPLIRVFIGAAALQVLWMAFESFLDVKMGVLRYAPIIVFLVASIGVLYAPFLEESIRKWLLYSLRQFFLFWVIGYCLFSYAKTDSEINRIRYRRKTLLFAVFALFVVATFVEDTAVMLFLDPSAVTSSDVLAYVYRRNISESILVICIAAYSIYLSIQTLQLKSREVPVASKADYHSRMQELLPYFARRHGLTAREQEILSYMIEGSDNVQIAGSLQLAIGTIKTHTHNIFKKTATDNREELVRLFWAEK